MAKDRTDLWKWVVAAIGAVISFVVIDYGKLQLEQFRTKAENHRALLDSYLRATESPQPDVWIRKLNLIIQFTDDPRLREWARGEQKYIEDFAALDALYRETLKVAGQLVEPTRSSTPERNQARLRFEQLYWSELPFAGESPEVEAAMVVFRRQLLTAEAAISGGDREFQWQDLSVKLIELSATCRKAQQSSRERIRARDALGTH